MGEENHQNRPHAVMVPYPLQGHVIPSVHLAIKLASRGFTITFINTHSIHHQTSQAAHADTDIFSAVRRSGVDIRYATVSDGLPVGFDRSLNHDQFMASLLHVFSAHVEEVVAKAAVEGGARFLIADTFFVWPSKLARKYGMRYVSFWTEPALVFSLYYHLDLLRLNRHFGCSDVREDKVDYIPGVESIDPKDMMSYLQVPDVSTVTHQIIFKAFDDVREADYVLCNTVQELEPNTITALQKKMAFYAVGPIFPAGFTKSIVPTSLWSESDCTQWLSTKPVGSVLYVSFGSYAHVNKKDLVEIANGLALSQVSFLWVLRRDIVSSEDTDPLPIGFREEISDRGIIIPWCCQIQVLKHEAVGGFLTHCGWNSILEGIWCGVPLLCFPLLTDQFTNRKLVIDDWKIGINLCSGKPITRSKVSEKIRCLMDETSGDMYKEGITKVRKILHDGLENNGSSEINFDKFVKDCISHNKMIVEEV